MLNIYGNAFKIRELKEINLMRYHPNTVEKSAEAAVSTHAYKSNSR